MTQSFLRCHPRVWSVHTYNHNGIRRILPPFLIFHSHGSTRTENLPHPAVQKPASAAVQQSPNSRQWQRRAKRLAGYLGNMAFARDAAGWRPHCLEKPPVPVGRNALACLCLCLRALRLFQVAQLGGVKQLVVNVAHGWFLIMCAPALCSMGGWMNTRCNSDWSPVDVSG